MCSYFIECTKAVKENDTIMIQGQNRTVQDMFSLILPLLNEMEQISRSDKFTFISKGSGKCNVANFILLKARKTGNDKDLDQCVTNYKLALSLDSNFIPALIGLVLIV